MKKLPWIATPEYLGNLCLAQGHLGTALEMSYYLKPMSFWSMAGNWTRSPPAPMMKTKQIAVYYIMRNRKLNPAVDTQAFKFFLNSTPHPPTACPLPSLHPPHGNSCGTNPSHMTWAGGRNLCGTSIPSFFPSFLSIWMSKPCTHILLLRVWPFWIAGMCSVFVTHTVCLIPYIDEIP